MFKGTGLSIMLSADGDKPTGKSGQRNRKTGQRSRKSGQQQSPSPDASQGASADQLQSITPEPSQGDQAQISEPMSEQISAPTASGENTPAETTNTEGAPVALAAPPETVPVSLQTIANAYGDYSRKSLEQTKSFFEQIAGVRSLDKALELQADFVRQACDTFVADAHKIRELHKELGRQNLQRLEGLVPGMPKAR
ncbi:MAG: phasin family protein [Bradyrhizobium sp.]|uniref:phasin family protein n=1 Tax=Bradyrhizobium sp. TaxID=376 RepID=UPI0025BDCED9|nr:phasin family protein [Bradyrhizobium sp.]MBI5263517.1 phasin family protein [Bradyrhizobium sp.]